MSLQVEIDQIRQQIRSDSYLMSIGELLSLYENQEINIHPELQRFYQWSHHQKTQFIESILLGIPLPPIFVVQREDGVWDVVDGWQRLSIIYEFLGKLKDEQENLITPLVLQGTKYLPSLAGKKWEDSEQPENSFTVAQRLLIKRAKINVIILLPDREIIQHELFQKLNTRGILASSQAIRTCILMMLNPQMYDWIKSLSEQENFQECIALSDYDLEQQYPLELVLKFLIFRTLGLEKLTAIKDLGVFLTDKMVEMAQTEDYNYQQESDAFEKTFAILSRDLGNNSFRRYSFRRDKFVGGFLVSAYELIALGIGYHSLSIDQSEIQIKTLVKQIWKDQDYINGSRLGISAEVRISKIVPLGRRMFKV